MRSEAALWSSGGKILWQHEFLSVSKSDGDCVNLLETTGIALNTREVLVVGPEIMPVVKELAADHASQLVASLRAVANGGN